LLARRLKEQSSVSYPAFVPNAYQPLYCLPGGSWVMGFEDRFPGVIAVLVDVNGALPPQKRGADPNADLKILVVNAQGQVIEVED
jgi:hypothetical protein